MSTRTEHKNHMKNKKTTFFSALLAREYALVARETIKRRQIKAKKSANKHVC